MTSCRLYLRRFWKDTRGATAIEFAMVIFPFILMILGVIEVSRALSIQGSLTRVADDTVRDVLICRIMIDEMEPSEIEAALQSSMNEASGLGGVGTATVIDDGSGEYVFKASMPYRFVMPIMNKVEIDLTVTRPLVDTCTE